MKPSVLWLTAPFIAALFSCQKQAPSPPPQSQAGTPQAALPEAGQAVLPPESHGYALRTPTSFMVLENDTDAETDKTKWAEHLTLGEKVQIIKKRRATWDGKTYDFVAVRRDTGREGLVFSSQFAEGGALAVVVKPAANLFKAPKTVEVTSFILPFKTLAVYFPETERDGFVEIKAYDPVNKIPRRNYIRMDSLSAAEADIQASILLQTAQEIKNEGGDRIRRIALLEAALRDFPDSVFAADIQALLDPGSGGEIKTEAPSQSAMTVNDDNVYIRELPNREKGAVIGQVNRGALVTVIAQTTADDTLEGVSARWYHISEPLAGWVFGGYLDAGQ